MYYITKSADHGLPSLSHRFVANKSFPIGLQQCGPIMIRHYDSEPARDS